MRAGRTYRLAAAAVLAACVIWPTVWLTREFAYFRDQRATLKLVRRLSDRRPPDVDADTWDVASGWAITAYCNVCFSPGHVSHDELGRFRADLEKRLQGRVDLGTIDWVWDRLGRTGPHGRSYQQRCEPLYREHLGATRGRR